MIEERRPPELAWLIAIESGAAWPAWVDAHRGEAEASVVVQQRHESADELLERVRHAARQLQGDGRTIETAVLAASRSVPVARRVTVAAELLGAVCPQRGHLVVTCPGASASERHELMTLAGTLMEAGECGDARVLLSFQGEPPPRSGVHARPARTVRRAAPSQERPARHRAARSV